MRLIQNNNKGRNGELNSHARSEVTPDDFQRNIKRRAHLKSQHWNEGRLVNAKLKHVECLEIIHAAHHEVVRTLLAVRSEREQTAIVRLAQELYAGLRLKGVHVIVALK